MLLIPGIALTNSLRDMFSGNTISGLMGRALHPPGHQLRVHRQHHAGHEIAHHVLVREAAHQQVHAPGQQSRLGGLLAALSVRIGLGENVDTISIGNIMLLIPGIALTNSLRDMLAGTRSRPAVPPGWPAAASAGAHGRAWQSPGSR